MAKLIDLTGKKFDKLLVLEKAPSINRKTAWKCKCDCGNEIIKTGEFLTRECKTIRDCGCTKKEKNVKEQQEKWNKENYLAGKKFGKLTVIKYLNKGGKYGKIWLCKCDCGNEVEVGTANLKNGHKTSCGCARMKDLTNQKFGKLTALYPLEKKESKDSFIWHCQCDCGNEKDVLGYNLTKGLIQSCGCINYSIGEFNIDKILNQNHIKFISQYTEPQLKKKRFDFAILNDDNQIIRLIEFDGQQHYEERKGFWNSNNPKQDLIELQQRDKEKNQYAKEHNIPLVRIPYWERDNIILDMIMGDEYLVG